MKYFVYELVDPRDNAVFYVGKGSSARMTNHRRDARKGYKTPKYDRIREIWSQGYEPSMRKLAYFTRESDALAFEIEKIAEIGLENLTNITAGGLVRGYAPINGGISKAALSAKCLEIRLKYFPTECSA